MDKSIYTAEILHGNCEEDLSRLRYLCDQGCETIDTLHAQIADLIQAWNPQRKLNAQQLSEAVSAFYDAHGHGYGAWAHYPWSRRVVRVLAENDFIALRTDRNQHKITMAEQTLLLGKTVGVVGLSVGQSVALTLALERSCGELRLADFDVIDLSNLNRLRCGIHNIGLSKAMVAAREIAEFDPFFKVRCFEHGYDEHCAEEFLDGLDVVVDECDSLDIKLTLRDAAKQRQIPVLMNTSDRGMTDIERFDLEPNRPIFHGSIGNMDPKRLVGLSTEEKVPIVMSIVGIESSSTRLRASMLEIEKTIKTWPQLASDVTLGGAVICDVTRRLLLDQPIASGRYYLDLAQIGNARTHHPKPETACTPLAVRDEPSRACPIVHPYANIIADAMLAPSAGNDQPWLWERVNSSLELRHRRDNKCGMLYYEDRAAMVGLGASLESAMLSAQHHGYRVDVETVSFGPEAPVARLHLTEQPDLPQDPLYAQLFRRRSVRIRPVDIFSIAPSVMDSINLQARRFAGLNLKILTERAQIRTLAELVGQAECLRLLDRQSHCETMTEIAWSPDEHRATGHGIPLDALSLSDAERAVLQIIRDPEVISELAACRLGTALGKLAHDLIDTSSAVGLLWSYDDTASNYLTGGRALQRIWLEATRADIGLCPVTPICYLLRAWRRGCSMSSQHKDELQAIEGQFRALFELPSSRGDIVLFRLVPTEPQALDQARQTLRRKASASASYSARRSINLT